MNKARLRRTILPLWTAVIAILALVLYLRGDRKGVLDGGRTGELPDHPGISLDVDEATARGLFAMTPETFRYDPTCYYRYEPYVDESFEWPEHPNGEWTRTTNLYGWRETGDEQLSDYDVRVLVTGDSHTDGACNNTESFPHLLEGLLQAHEDAAGTGARTGVQNSGIVGYSFHNHLGVLRMHLDQDLHAFVVAVYGGNDFAESIRPQHYFRGTRPSARRTGYWGRIEAARRVSDHAVAQSLNQALLFDEQPEEIEVALDAVRFTATQIRDLCELNDIRLIYAYIPPAFDVPWADLDASRDRAMEALDLDDDRMSVSRELKRSLFGILDELGVHYLDLEPEFRAQSERCYWAKDLHINLLGHERVAAALESALASGAGAIGASSAPRDGMDWSVDGRGRLRAAGRWESGERSGQWREWYPSGDLRSAGRWSGGERVGVWTWWYPGGGLQRQGEMRDGRPHGVWRDWHSNGLPAQWSAYVDGVPQGLWMQWWPGGELTSAGCYLDGKRCGEWWTFREDGSPEARAEMWDGRSVGDVRRLPR
jgi:lysophospholipase L1-like esterase